jgi:hypothetical protein
VDTTQVIIDFIQSLSDQVYEICDWPGTEIIDFEKIKIHYFNKYI